eukprot:TRINITY_DN22965_c0_g1_i2.p3 TRINITY_DN22965_c0_g1~~TRINITY_DN22965_c0_g1_i2.p3  ORF type:complete len:101 (+),score=38.76 TRINITY_DN22965_c0_g1_i2:279-581(+)
MAAYFSAFVPGGCHKHGDDGVWVSFSFEQELRQTLENKADRARDEPEKGRKSGRDDDDVLKKKKKEKKKKSKAGRPHADDADDSGTGADGHLCAAAYRCL